MTIQAQAPEQTPISRVHAIKLGRRSALVIALVSVIGFAMFAWPFFVSAAPQTVAHSSEAPFIFVLVLPALIAIVLAELSEGGMDSKALAMLGVLAGVNAALRLLGAGTAGVETVFFLLILSARVFGPGFGYVLGCISMFASALLTAGVGPWLPFQMLAASWVALGAGLLPRNVRGKAEIAMLAVYGVVAAYGFGMVMNLWFWPFTTGLGTQLSYVPGAPIVENLQNFLAFTVFSSTLGWDTGRAITNAVAIVLVGPAVLVVLRRVSRRASFGVDATFGRD